MSPRLSKRTGSTGVTSSFAASSPTAGNDTKEAAITAGIPNAAKTKFERRFILTNSSVCVLVALARQICPLSFSGKFHEVFQQLQADLLALLRVKLRRENVVAPDGRRKGVAVFRARGDNRLGRRLGIKAVDEIHVAAAGDAAIERAIGLHDFNLVPPDLRNLQSVLFGKADDAALEDAQPGGAGIKLVAPFKQRLIADADAEERFAGLDEVARGLEQFLFAQGIDAIVERADAGQHHRI